MDSSNKMSEYIKIDHNKHNFFAGLRILEFKNDLGQIVLYVPSLQLSAYGDNRVEAREMLDVITIEYGIKLSKLPEHKASAELSKYGWKREVFFKKKFKNQNPYVDVKGILKNFDLPEETLVKEEFLTV